MTNKEIARVLQETADLIKLTGGNEFRARAFSNAGRSIEQLEEAAEQRVREGTLTELSGIGEGLAEDIARLVEDGKLPQHQELLARIPPGLTDVLRVKGLGPSRVRSLWQELGITSLDELEAAGQADRLTNVKGFGKKTQQNILEQVKLLRQYLNRYLYAEAYTEAEGLLEHLRGHPAVVRAEVTGRLRRKLEVVRRIDLAAASSDPGEVREDMTRWFQQMDTTTSGDDVVVTGALESGLPFSVLMTSPQRFGTAWWESTGSDDHCEHFIDRYGRPGDVSEEAKIYEDAGISWIPPELRENAGELDAALEDRLPNLIEPADMRGSIHNHTTYSDGANTVEEMARAARSMGLSYLALCDHSRSLTIANGLSIERVKEQRAEIDRVNQKLADEGGRSFRIFRGIESDILADGSLDYPDDVLESFELVVGSIHSRFNMSEQEATDRIIRAVENPHLDILGHPTGRLLLRREGYPVNFERVIAACGKHDVAIELNANPRRLDIDWRWVRDATDAGVLIAINPDAHSVEELQYVRWGIEVARKGWLRADQCLNTKSLDAFTDWLR